MKKIILAIDIQNEYVTKDRPFYIKEIKESLNNALSIIETARKQSIPVWHMQHQQEKNVFIKGNILSEFITEFKPQADEPHFTKEMYSCFSSPEFTKKLAEEKPEEIIIVGYGSSMCCTCTIIDGIHRGYHFTIVENATASRSFDYASEEEMHRSAINVLAQYAKIKNTKELVSELENTSSIKIGM